MSRGGLGKGLESLIPTGEKFAEKIGIANTDVLEVSVDDISPNPKQPRYNFDEEALEELATSIKEYGVIQPLIVTKKGERYELIAGERRLRASKIAGLKKVPIVIRTYSEQQKLEIAIIENIQRHDLNPLEEAMAYQRLVDDFNLTQEEVAKSVSKSRSAVANTLRLINLPLEIKKGLVEGKITEGHARAILSASTPEEQIALYELIVHEGLNVRAAEAKAKATAPNPKSSRPSDSIYYDLEKQLREQIGSKVKITGSAKGGKITIDFYSGEELERIIDHLS